MELEVLSGLQSGPDWLTQRACWSWLLMRSSAGGHEALALGVCPMVPNFAFFIQHLDARW